MRRIFDLFPEFITIGVQLSTEISLVSIARQPTDTDKR